MVWAHPSDFTDIRGSRVSPAGVVLDPTGIPISTAPSWQWEPAIASDGESYFVVCGWDQRSTNDVYGTPVAADGTVLDPNGILISSGHDASHPAIAFDGENYLVAWLDNGGDGDIYGARVTPAGELLDPGGIPISTAAGSQAYPSVAFDGANYMVAWED